VPIASTPDHVAVAVPDIPTSLQRWRDVLGGLVLWDFHNPTVFRGATLGFNGGGKLELLAPSEASEREMSTGGPSGFVEAFLERFGTRVHHLTLKVPDLETALEVLRAEGVEPTDVDLSDPTWREAFVRPSDVGGLIVQLAATPYDDAKWAEVEGSTLPALPVSGPRLLGPTLTSTDLAASRRIWTLLGATVHDDGADGDDAFTATWDDGTIDVRVQHGQRAGAVGLRFADAGPRPSDPALGPPVLAVR